MQSQNIAYHQESTSIVQKSERIIAKKESDLKSNQQLERNIKTETISKSEVEIGHIEF